MQSLVRLMVLALVLIAGSGVGVRAQLLDYGSLIGGGGNSTPADSIRQSAPLQSTPPSGGEAPAFDPANVPSAQEYGALTGTTSGEMLNATQQGVDLFRSRARRIVEDLPVALSEVDTALAVASPTGRPSYFLGVAIFAGLLLIVGRAVTQLYAIYIARRLFVSLQRPNPQGYAEKLPVLVYRLLLTVLGVVLNLSVASATGLVFYNGHEATLITVIIVFATSATVMILDTLWRVTIAPYLSEYRLPVIEDGDARSLFASVSSVSYVVIVGMAFLYWMQALGLSSEAQVALSVLLSTVAVVLLLGVLRMHRRAISGVLMAGRSREQASWLTRAAVTLWGPMAAAYLLLTWGDVVFRLVMGIDKGTERLLMPFAIFMAGLAIYALTAYLIERIFARTRAVRQVNDAVEARRRAEIEAEVDGVAKRADGLDLDDGGGDSSDEGGGPAVSLPQPVAFAPSRSGMRTMEDLARRVASLFAVGAGAYFLVRFWAGPDIFETNPWISLAEDMIDTVFLGYIAYHAVRIWIDQRIEEEGGDTQPSTPGEGEGGGAGATRLATLLPLVRNFVLIVILTTVILILMMELGVNVAPLFAGAGIVGLAIGFGAQTLVRDILSGAFFLMDDAFRKGEYIDVGEVKGTVEKISLRSFQLRHHLGMLHTIPFGEIQYLTNFSRDWVMMKLPLRLTYDTDIERVRKLIKKLGQALLDDTEIGHKFIQPLKSQGVIQMDDSAMIVRVKFMTYPGEQWVLRKRVYADIRNLFESEGIKFAHREVTVRLPDIENKDELSEGQVRAIGAAARRAVDQVEEEMQPAGTAEIR